MAESVTIARPYAQAVFRLAREAGSEALWLDRLTRLALVAQDEEMARVVGNPKFSPAEIVALFIDLSGEAGNAELESFVGVLVANERIVVLPQIRDVYEELKSAAEGVREAVVSSPYALDDAQLRNLMNQLETHFGGKLQPRVELDPALIGGVKVVVGDQVLDASVRGKLDAMAAALKN